jgi:hypothetical protein
MRSRRPSPTYVLGAGGPSDVEWSGRLGPVLHADTSTPVDTAALAAAIRAGGEGGFPVGQCGTSTDRQVRPSVDR